MAANVIGALQIRLSASDDAFNAGLKRARQRLRGLRQSAQDFTQAGLALGGVTAVLGGLARGAGRASSELNKGMANVATLIPDATGRVEELKTAVQDLAVAHGRQTQDLTAGLYQTISAFGDQAGRTMEILRINSEAAAAGVATTEDAIALTSAVTKAYGDTSAAAVRKASDLAFVTVRLGQTSFPELAAAIGKTTPLAAALGVRQEELAASYATLSGVVGTTSEVSTGLRGILSGLIRPTKGLREAVAALGAADAQTLVETHGLQGALTALIGTTDGSQEAVAALFGSIDGVGSVLQLTGASADQFSANLQAMEGASGATTQAFRAQTEGVDATGHAWRTLTAELRRVQEDLGDVLLPILGRALDQIRPLLDRVVDLVRGFGDLPQGVQTAGVAFAAMIPAISTASLVLGGLGAAFVPLRAKIGAVTAAWTTLLGGILKMPPALKAATVASGRLGGALISLSRFAKLLWRSLLGPVGIALALWEVVSALGGAEDQLDDTTRATDEGSAAWQDYRDTLREVSDDHAAAIGQMATDILTGVASFDQLADEADRVRGQVGTTDETIHVR